MNTSAKPLSEQLLDAADAIENVSLAELQLLLRRAAIEVRASEFMHTETLEHVPVYLYHLLRRLGGGPVRLSSLQADDDKGAVAFLTSRGLATIEGPDLVITRAGRAIGEVEDHRDT